MKKMEVFRGQEQSRLFAVHTSLKLALQLRSTRRLINLIQKVCTVFFFLSIKGQFLMNSCRPL